MYSNDYVVPNKADLKKISIDSLPDKLPNFKNADDTKPVIIGKWLVNWINDNIDSLKNCILPRKDRLAYKLGVSIGTIQNALRYIENLGYVESKQCIGTIIKDKNEISTNYRKLTSKKDLAIELLKQYIKTDAFEVGELLPSTKTISTILGYSENTIRPALEYLTINNILEKNDINNKNSGWKVASLDFEVQSELLNSSPKTLVDKCVVDLENYITNNYSIGDKLPPHYDLVKILKVSMKTIHDALLILAKKNIILPKRGKYGTTIVKMPNSTTLNCDEVECSRINSEDFYCYEKIQKQLIKMIANEYEVGDKLPSILDLSKKFKLSQNTIGKALHNLSKEGYIVFSRGRYGGTFVIDIPELDEPAFKWIALESEYIKSKIK